MSNTDSTKTPRLKSAAREGFDIPFVVFSVLDWRDNWWLWWLKIFAFWKLI